jgi:hypothetical protein
VLKLSISIWIQTETRIFQGSIRSIDARLNHGGTVPIMGNALHAQLASWHESREDEADARAARTFFL